LMPAPPWVKNRPAPKRIKRSKNAAVPNFAVAASISQTPLAGGRPRGSALGGPKRLAT
jgi:hypothetical protein